MRGRIIVVTLGEMLIAGGVRAPGAEPIADFAARAGIDPATVSRYARGVATCRPTPRIARRIAAALRRVAPKDVPSDAVHAVYVGCDEERRRHLRDCALADAANACARKRTRERYPHGLPCPHPRRIVSGEWVE